MQHTRVGYKLNYHLTDRSLVMIKTVSLTVKKKFEAVFVTVAMTDEHFCRDFTNIVHIMALKTNTKLKQKTLKPTATCKQCDKYFNNISASSGRWRII